MHACMPAAAPRPELRAASTQLRVVKPPSHCCVQAHVCDWEVQPHTAGEDADAPSARLQPNPAVWDSLGLLLQPYPSCAAAGSSGDATATASTRGSSSSSLACSLLDWPLLARLSQLGAWSSAGSLHVECGGQDALLPAQYACEDRIICQVSFLAAGQVLGRGGWFQLAPPPATGSFNFYSVIGSFSPPPCMAQVSGRRRMLLVPPSHAFPGACPYPVAHPYDRYSCVDWEEPELDEWPDAGQVCTNGTNGSLKSYLTIIGEAVWGPAVGAGPAACAVWESVIYTQFACQRLCTHPHQPPIHATLMLETW